MTREQLSPATKYHGEVFDNGRPFLTVESETGYGPLVTLKITDNDGLNIELQLRLDDARELARHMTNAVEAIG